MFLFLCVPGCKGGLPILHGVAAHLPAVTLVVVEKILRVYIVALLLAIGGYLLNSRLYKARGFFGIFVRRYFFITLVYVFSLSAIGAAIGGVGNVACGG